MQSRKEPPFFLARGLSGIASSTKSAAGTHTESGVALGVPAQVVLLYWSSAAGGFPGSFRLPSGVLLLRVGVAFSRIMPSLETPNYVRNPADDEFFIRYIIVAVNSSELLLFFFLLFFGMGCHAWA